MSEPETNLTIRRPGGLLHGACAAAAWGFLHPMRVPPAITPGMLGLEYRKVRLRNGEVDLAAWHVPRAGSRAGIVLCHGHNDCRTQFLPLLRPLHRAGFHLMLFDFRTMGVSGGSACTYGYHEQTDVLTAVEWLRAEAGVERVGLMGYSMGGACALLAAARDPEVAAVATDCAFARLEEMIERKLLAVPAGLRGTVGRSVQYWAERWVGEVTRDVDPEEAVRQWRPRPLLVIHGERDLLVPPEHGRRLAAAGGEPAELWMVRGAGHVACRRWARREYYPRVAEFFRRHLLG